MITIKTLQKVKTDPSYVVDGANAVKFINTGQSAVLIDEQIYLECGEDFTEGDTRGLGINHSYQIDFITLDNPPPVTPYKTVAGNMLKIRLYHRKK